VWHLGSAHSAVGTSWHDKTIPEKQENKMTRISLVVHHTTTMACLRFVSSTVLSGWIRLTAFYNITRNAATSAGSLEGEGGEAAQGGDLPQQRRAGGGGALG